MGLQAPRRPTGYPGNPEIVPNRWEMRRVSDPILPTRWDESGDAGDVVRLPGCRSGRMQNPQQAAAAGKFGRPPHQIRSDPRKKRPRIAQGPLFRPGQGFGQGCFGRLIRLRYVKLCFQTETAPGTTSIWPCLFPWQPAQPERVLTFECPQQRIFPSPVWETPDDRRGMSSCCHSNSWPGFGRSPSPQIPARNRDAELPLVVPRR